MKQVSLALNVLLVIAVAGLYWMQFSDSDGESEELDGQTEEMVQSRSAGSSMADSKIIYVDLDSLQSNYNLYLDFLDDLIKEKETLERQYQLRVSRFQGKMETFRQKAPLLSQREGERQQASLLQEEQDLLQLQEDMSIQLAESEASKNELMRKKIIDKIEEINASGQYDFVLSYSSASTILYANDSLDITKKLVDILNSEYEAEKQANKGK